MPEAPIPTASEPDPLTPLEVRQRLVEALRYDLVGPGPTGFRAEERIQPWLHPANEYLLGFLVPSGAPPEQRSDPTADEEAEELPDRAGLEEEESGAERRAAKKSFFPSSMGLSFLLPAETEQLEIEVRWGDYEMVELEGEAGEGGEEEEGAQEGEEGEAGGGRKVQRAWQRTPQVRTVAWEVPEGTDTPVSIPVPDSGNGLHLLAQVRPVSAAAGGALPASARAVSLFLVNDRPAGEDRRDETFAFQAELELHCAEGFLPRPDLRGRDAEEWDARVGDLHYADTPEYASGHGVSTTWELEEGLCRRLRTSWIPEAFVEKTETVAMEEVTLSMQELGALADGAAAGSALQPLVDQYRVWIEGQEQILEGLSESRRETARQLLHRARRAADRMEDGVRLLGENADALEAFRLANRAVARALVQRLEGVTDPTWRAFQLAFLLLNLRGTAEPGHLDREEVDLLFFPTGGGKTEAYLGLAAFAMVLRRLRNPGLGGAGVSVIMRYTLRLLTLDQLGRAAALVCALELEREEAVERLGPWPFEIGLWVGKAGTPNHMGKKGDRRRDTARSKTIAFKNDPKSKPAPIPLEECPWCGTKFKTESFNLLPNTDRPNDLRITCASPSCAFVRNRPLPIVAVDEPLYRRLPAFLVATVDKFASLPWVGESGLLLGGATRAGDDGFYGPATPGAGRPLPAPLPPPDLIIQDELHLISGPLGTIAGLYETAIEALCTREEEGKAVRPKIVASTATARRAQDQIQALFGRAGTTLFPPPGPSRRDSFFARTRLLEEVPGRQYVGVPVVGRSPKVVMMKVWLALMGAAQAAFLEQGKEENPENPADSYMTVLGYFNSLKELGGCRRILEEEVHSRGKKYGMRKRLDEERGLFRDRKYFNEVVELTSRVETNEVAAAKRRLGTRFDLLKERVDSAIATNMISVGLDIPRLGLMVVNGQPKAHAEYIQATSRVGRDEKRGPGLVVTILSTHKPRDRSHFERFRHYHETFYRSVEVASVTPFSARALDRALAGALVTFARHRRGELTPPQGVEKLQVVRPELAGILRDVFLARAETQPIDDEEVREALFHSLDHRVADLLDSWEHVMGYYRGHGVPVQYQKYELREAKPLLREMLEQDFVNEHHRKFRVNRSMRGVEPSVNLFLRSLTGEEDEA